jgi:hypothetical protein
VKNPLAFRKGVFSLPGTPFHNFSCTLGRRRCGGLGLKLEGNLCARKAIEAAHQGKVGIEYEIQLVERLVQISF